jgi:hypothetical protein
MHLQLPVPPLSVQIQHSPIDPRCAP